MAANLEASLQVVQERQSAKRHHAWTRRQALGPDPKERACMESALEAWQRFRVVQTQLRQRLVHAHAYRSHCFLLLSLDQWVDSALSQSRAETLRRRRHVRFSPEMGHLRKQAGKGTSDGQNLVKRGARVVASGGLGNGRRTPAFGKRQRISSRILSEIRL